MKTYKASFADVAMKQVKHEHPERTAWRVLPGIAGDYMFQVWPSRESMLTTVRMQGKSAPNWRHWTPVIK